MQRILIVDDSHMARMFIRRCLEITGYGDAEIIEATNGKEALIRLREGKVDVVISDLNMPVMDGESLLQWIKSVPMLKEIPVIFITSVNNPAKAEQLLAQGAHQILGKPLSPEVLAQTLQTLAS